MSFRDMVEDARPRAVSEDELLEQKNKMICNFVIEAAKEEILKQAKEHPKDGSPLKITGSIYLGTFLDGMIDAVIEVTGTEKKRFLSSKKDRHSVIKVSQNGEQLLETMRAEAQKDDISIQNYLIEFGDGATSDNDELYRYVHGLLLTNLFLHTLALITC